MHTTCKISKHYDGAYSHDFSFEIYSRQYHSCLTVREGSDRETEEERERVADETNAEKCSKGVQFVRELCSCGAPGGAM